MFIYKIYKLSPLAHEPLVIRIHIPPLSNPSILILCLPNLIADVIECVLCSYTNNHRTAGDEGREVHEEGDEGEVHEGGDGGMGYIEEDFGRGVHAGGDCGVHAAGRGGYMEEEMGGS